MKANSLDFDVTVKPGETKRNAFIRTGIELFHQTIDNNNVDKLVELVNSRTRAWPKPEKTPLDPPEIKKAKADFEKVKKCFYKGFEEEINDSEDLAKTYYDIGTYCIEGRILKESDYSYKIYYPYFLDYDGAIKYFSKSADMGYYKAMAELGNMYYLGPFKCSVDYGNHPEAESNQLFDFCNSHSIGQSDFMGELGIKTYVDIDYMKAREWFIKLVAKRDIILEDHDILYMREYPNALKNIGFTYCYVEKDENKAAEWLFKACDVETVFGGSLNYVRLGNYYFNGDRPIPQNYKRAFECYSKAASLYSGDQKIEALRQLAKMYSNGLGVTKNEAQAEKLKALSIKISTGGECEDSFSGAIGLPSSDRILRGDVHMGPDGNYYDDYGDYVPDDCIYDDY